MCKIKDSLLKKIYKQIDDKKTSINKPTIDTLVDGSITPNFDQWEDSILETKTLLIRNIDNLIDDKIKNSFI